MTYRQAFYTALIRTNVDHDFSGALMLCGPFANGDDAAKYLPAAEKHSRDAYIIADTDSFAVIGVFMPVLPIGCFNAKLWVDKGKLI